MCDHSPNREAAMVVIREGIWCDPCLEPLVRALNDGGLQTIASCCGHGHRPGTVILADGRWLVLASDDEARRIDAIFPVDVNGSDTSVNAAESGRDVTP